VNGLEPRALARIHREGFSSLGAAAAELMDRYWEWSGFVVRLVLERICAAVPEIAPVFRGTPQYECEQLGARLGCRITLKVECLNPVRCFKGRGTEVVLARLIGGEGPRSVICASAGNLGQALAYSGRRRGIACTVVASATANPVKLRRMHDLGATVHLVDGDIEVARRAARDLADRDDVFLVEDSENLATCEGAGTIGLEIVEAPEPFDAVLLAVGGGALVTGVGHVLKSLAPSTAVVGVQPAGAPAMTLSWRARRVVETETVDTIADGVAGRHPIPEVLDDLLVVATTCSWSGRTASRPECVFSTSMRGWSSSRRPLSALPPSWRTGPDTRADTSPQSCAEET
jgi:threonine dehydratase